MNQIYFARPIEGFDELLFMDIAGGETHSTATFSNIDLPWNFSWSEWEVIGYGHNPPQKLERTPVGLEYKKVKDLFENKLHRNYFTMHKMFAVDNPILETHFRRKFPKKVENTENIDLSNSFNWNKKRDASKLFHTGSLEYL